MLIFIIGYMGCGKSSLGHPLSKLFNYKFIDLDTYIEEHNSMSVTKMFHEFGEGYFRRVERDLLINISESEDNCIISTGGGTPCYDDNMDIMNRYGLTVYLDIDADVLSSRLINSKKKRPLLADKSDDELNEFVVKSVEKREQYYKKSKINITGRNIKPADIFTLINGYNNEY